LYTLVLQEVNILGLVNLLIVEKSPYRQLRSGRMKLERTISFLLKARGGSTGGKVFKGVEDAGFALGIGLQSGQRNGG
jgi:hypothetical protein